MILGSRGVILVGGERFIRRIIDAAVVFGVAEDYVWLVATDWEFTETELLELVPTDSVLKVKFVLDIRHLNL